MPYTDNIGTFTLTDADSPFTISRNMGVMALSIRLVSGTVTYTGSMSLGSRTSDAITLTSGAPFSAVGQEPIDGLVITIAAGASCQLSTRS